MKERGILADDDTLRERERVFRDRSDAGRTLAALLRARGHDASLVLGVAAGGIPVARVLAEELALPLEVMVVSKITLPWNSEAGYGAVAFDGTVRLNHALIALTGLGERDVAEGIARTRDKVARRTLRLRGERPLPELARHVPLLVDDGLASGFTLLSAVRALRNQGARRVLAAVPTAHAQSAQALLEEVDALYCANLRSGPRFAVADAYREWADVADEQAAALLQGLAEGVPAPRKGGGGG